MRVQVLDKTFKEFISEEEIKNRVAILGKMIEEDYKGKKPVFLGILNGAFIFLADLIRAVNLECEVSFMKLSSYKGFTSTGEVVFSGPIDPMLKGRDIIIVEDIIDSGKTMKAFLPALQSISPKSIRIASLLIKWDKLEVDLKPEYIGFEIPPEFVVGYGLDYDGFGRDLRSVYILDGG